MQLITLFLLFSYCYVFLIFVSGVYTQELLSHRTVYGSAQINPVSDTGAVTYNGGFSYITHIGESSIPFLQFLSAGSGQIIPATSQTGSIRWQDIWGRTLVEPLRSLILDAAPLPGPLRNFQMTTTFELLSPTSNTRSLIWHSDDTLTVRVQLKFLNNYEKWWVLTNSKNNELLFTAGQSYPATNFVTAANSYPNQVSGPLSSFPNTTYLNYGYTNFYGTSLSSGTVWLNGTLLTTLQMQEVSNSIYCVSNYSSACDYIGTLPIPTRMPSTASIHPPTTWWNYASSVNSYWPQGYIDEAMWSLSDPNLDDNVFDYGYNYVSSYRHIDR